MFWCSILRNAAWVTQCAWKIGTSYQALYQITGFGIRAHREFGVGLSQRGSDRVGEASVDRWVIE
jgi:hypothetical protein